MVRVESGISGWWTLVLGLLIGALAPSLVAWGSMSSNIKHNADEIKDKVDTTVFVEYKKGNTKLLETMVATLVRIENNQNAK